MTLRTVVLPLGFGAALCASAAEEAPARRPPVRVYTNEDLDRVHPFRDETGIRSVPATSPDPPAPAPAEKRRGRGEDYWRREAARVRDRVRVLEAKAADLQARVAERRDQASHWLAPRRRSSSGSFAEATLLARISALETRRRQLEEDLADRARRDGALPGWLR